MDNRPLLAQLPPLQRWLLYAKGFGRCVSPWAFLSLAGILIPVTILLCRGSLGWGTVETQPGDIPGLCVVSILCALAAAFLARLIGNDLAVARPGWRVAIGSALFAAAAGAALLANLDPRRDPATVAALRATDHKIHQGSLALEAAAHAGLNPYALAQQALAQAEVVRARELLDQDLKENASGTLILLLMPLSILPVLASCFFSWMGRKSFTRQSFSLPRLSPWQLICLLASGFVAIALLVVAGTRAAIRKSMELIVHARDRVAESAILDEQEWAAAELRAIGRETGPASDETQPAATRL